MTATDRGTARRDWLDENQRGLTAELDRLRLDLEQATDGGSPRDVGSPPVDGDAPRAGTALDVLTQRFGLSSFERRVLLLCAGIELDERFAPLCGRAHGEAGGSYPTFGLALRTLPDAHWSAVTPAGPLRRWKLLELDPSGALVRARLRIDERILHFLAGVQHLDDRLTGLVTSVRARLRPALVPSHAEVARQIAGLWSGPGAQNPPLVQLCGVSRADRREVAAAACAAIDVHLYRISTSDVPSSAAERETLVRLWEREAALTGSVLLLEVDDADPERGAVHHEAVRRRLVERMKSPLMTSSRDRVADVSRPAVAFDVGKPAPAEQREVWREVLGNGADAPDGQIDALVAQFNLSAQTIGNVGAALVGPIRNGPSLDGPSLDGPILNGSILNGTAVNGGPSSVAERRPPAEVWAACLVQARPRLDDLAQRIEPSAGWDDLVLPAAQVGVLHQIADQLRQRSTVYEAWGFADRSARGLGISALFAGASGTGKTMAAEVLSRDLRLDLYRIDLSQVVSKYIGETEKNLRRVFEAAEDGGAILLFDEADALFGKRSEVKDSHDRYANIEVSYLLQRMEAYRGLAVLTTNMKSALDPAFLRRLRFVVQFPFPDAAQRAEVWRRVFPAATPVEGLEIEKLARLNVTGGNIANIAMNAAFLAATAGEPVRMGHLRQATSAEYAKLERPLSEAEVGSW